MRAENIKCIGEQVDKLLSHLQANKPIIGKAAVFFDIDGTINRNDSLELFISEIVRRDLLPRDKEEIFGKKHRLWKSREMSFEDYLDNVVELISYLKSFSYDSLMKIAGDVINNQGSYYYLFPWILLLKLKGFGYELIAISGAPEFMAKMYLEKIGLFPREINGSKYLFKDNIFTGILDISVLKDKGSFIEKKYKDSYDLKKCIALGDTVSDISMFRCIGKPIAVNPTRALAIEAEKNKWPVVMERKDLVLLFPKGKLGLGE